MMRTAWLGAVVIAGAAAIVACGGSDKKTVAVAAAPGGSKDPSNWPADDRSMCDWRNKPELDVAETAGPGSFRPNVRRVFKVEGEGDMKRRILKCREIDTNLDGIKDVVRTFNNKGEPLHEEADTNYDGKIDVWINFVDGRLVEEDEDTNHDGKPDVWKFYVDGQLQRIRRDRNGDGKPDEWEMYSKGRLDRVGVDDTYDGHVDRWDRDEQLKYEADTAEKNAEKKARDAEGDGGITTVSPPTINTPPPAATPADAGAPTKKPAAAAKKK